MLELRHGQADGGQRDLECPRVVIADHHLPTRAGVRLALERDGFIVAAEEGTAADAVAAVVEDPPEICLLDVDMPGGGIDAARAIRSQAPETQVVMLSDAEDDDTFFEALHAGASGYLSKQMNAARLGPALRDVLNGRAAVPRALTARLIDEFRARVGQDSPTLARPGSNDLTRREWEVIDCLREGLSTRRIAKRLFISETTVRRHVGSILKKLGVPTREAAVKAIARRSRNLNAE